MKRAIQGSFEFKSWGGARKGAGRNRVGDQKCVPHRTRPALVARHPVHVTLRLEAGLESLRKRRTYSLVRGALAAGADRLGLRLVHFSVMTNHLHFICEARDERALASGIKGVCVRIARALNALWERAGRVFADRYHAHVLKSPREVRNALNYVLRNAAHHHHHFAGPDPCSSGAWFDGWVGYAERVRDLVATSFPAARSWLLQYGWRRHGLIDLVPRAI